MMNLAGEVRATNFLLMWVGFSEVVTGLKEILWPGNVAISSCVLADFENVYVNGCYVLHMKEIIT